MDWFWKWKWKDDLNYVCYFELLMDLKFYLTIGFDCWNWYLIKDGEMLYCYCELIGIGLKIFGVDVFINVETNIYIEIDVGFIMLMRLIVHTVTKLRIPFEDEYVCGLQTHLRVVHFLDNLRLVFCWIMF